MKKINISFPGSFFRALKNKFNFKVKLKKKGKADKKGKGKKFRISFSKRNIAGLVLLAGFAGLAFFTAKDGWLAVALVNNRPISRLALVQRLEKQGGKQALDNLITETLIRQEAKKTGNEASEQEIDDRIKEIKAQLKSQGRDLDEVLAASGQTMPEVKRQIGLQLMVEKMAGKDVKIDDKKVSDFFEKNKDAFYKGKKLADVKEQIRSQLRQQEINSKVSAWIKGLKDKASIRYFVKFGK